MMIQRVLRIATSRTAIKGALNVSILATSYTITFFLSALAVALFHAKYVPDHSLTWPIYLQYGQGINPFSLTVLGDKLPSTHQDYDVSVALSLPASSKNMELGNFMIELLMISSATSEEQVNMLSQATSPQLSSLTLAKSLSRDPLLLKSRRPALIPHQDPLVAMFKRILLLPWYAMSNSRSRITIETTLVERVQFPSRAQLPKAMFVDIQAGQSIQTYSASIKFVARMHGLRYLMYHYRALCYVVLTSLFWASSMGFMTVTWFVWVTLIKLSSQEPQSNMDVPKLPQFESRHKSLKDDSLLHSQIKQEAEDSEYGMFTETPKFSNDALRDEMEKDEKEHGPVNIKTESDDEGRRGRAWKDKNKARNAIGRQPHEPEVHQMMQSTNIEVAGTSSGWSSNDDSSAVRHRSQHNI